MILSVRSGKPTASFAAMPQWLPAVFNAPMKKPCPKAGPEVEVHPQFKFPRKQTAPERWCKAARGSHYLQKLPTPMLDNARQRSARPCPICWTETAREMAFPTSPGLYVGRACKISAASPAINGVLNDVPQPAAKLPPG